MSNQLKVGAIIGGASILIMTIAAMIATGMSIGSLYIEGDVTGSAENIISNASQYRLGVISWLIILICDVLASWGLYLFLKPVNKVLSSVAAWLRILYSVLLGAAILKLIQALFLLKQIGAGEELFAEIYGNVHGFYGAWSLGLILFGIHVFFLGYLIWKSNYVPNYIGILLLIASVGYVLVHSLKLIVPQFKEVIQIIEYIFILPMMSEVVLGIWLLGKGRKVQEIG